MPSAAPVLLLLAEACWIAVVALVVAGLFALEPGVAAAVGMVLVGYLVSKLVRMLRVSDRVSVLGLASMPTLAAVGVSAVLLSLVPAAALPLPIGDLALAAAVAGFAWARGWVLAIGAPGFGGAATVFQTGLAIAAGAIVLATLLDGVPSGPALPLTAAGFLACGLGALIAARAHVAGKPHGTGALMLGLTIAVAVVVALVLDRSLLLLLATPLIWIWGMLGALLDWILALMPEPAPLEAESMPGTASPSPDQPVTWRGGLPDWVRTAGQIAWYGGWALLLLHIVYSNLRALLRRLGAGGGDRTDEGVRLAGSVWTELRGLVHWAALMMSRLLHRLLREDPGGVRRLYRRLLARGVRRGVPRRGSETPGEYARRLSSLFPADGQAVIAVTRAYLPARYGAVRPQAAALSAAEAALRGVRLRRRKPPIGDDTP